MWGSEIVGKDFTNGVLKVQVRYSTQGQTPITEWIDMTGGSSDILEEKIRSRLATLNDSADLISAIKNGSFVPKQKATTDRETYFNAYLKLDRLDRAAALGIIDRSDPEYVEALNAAKSAFSWDFFDISV